MQVFQEDTPVHVAKVTHHSRRTHSLAGVSLMLRDSSSGIVVDAAIALANIIQNLPALCQRNGSQVVWNFWLGWIDANQGATLFRAQSTHWM